jgi:hypothetical protein
MEHPTPQRIVAARVNEFTLCTSLLLDAGHTLPALIILFTAVDIFGSLLRAETEADTAGKYFKKWVDDYMLGHSQVSFTAQDLWGARCGLLHTHTAASRLSREGAARELHYYLGSPPPGMEQILRSLEHKGKLFVDVVALNRAFSDGAHRFLEDLDRSPDLAKRVQHHAPRVFGSWTNVG